MLKNWKYFYLIVLFRHLLFAWWPDPISSKPAQAIASRTFLWNSHCNAATLADSGYSVKNNVELEVQTPEVHPFFYILLWGWIKGMFLSPSVKIWKICLLGFCFTNIQSFSWRLFNVLYSNKRFLEPFAGKEGVNATLSVGLVMCRAIRN